MSGKTSRVAMKLCKMKPERSPRRRMWVLKTTRVPKLSAEQLEISKGPRSRIHYTIQRDFLARHLTVNLFRRTWVTGHLIWSKGVKMLWCTLSISMGIRSHSLLNSSLRWSSSNAKKMLVGRWMLQSWIAWLRCQPTSMICRGRQLRMHARSLVLSANKWSQSL